MDNGGKKIVIIGASGHGKVVADIACRNGYEDIAFLDDNDALKECAGFPVIGKVCEAENIFCDKVVAIGNAAIRKSIQNRLVNVVTLVHHDAVISRRVMIGKGTVVMARAVINSDAKIGDGCIINTCASVDHDCIISDYTHVSVGAHVAGTVTIGDGTWIGAGAVVVGNIAKKGTYIGVLAKEY